MNKFKNEHSNSILVTNQSFYTINTNFYRINSKNYMKMMTKENEKDEKHS